MYTRTKLNSYYEIIMLNKYQIYNLFNRRGLKIFIKIYLKTKKFSFVFKYRNKFENNFPLFFRLEWLDEWRKTFEEFSWN